MDGAEDMARFVGGDRRERADDISGARGEEAAAQAEGESPLLPQGLAGGEDDNGEMVDRVAAIAHHEARSLPSPPAAARASVASPSPACRSVCPARCTTSAAGVVTVPPTTSEPARVTTSARTGNWLGENDLVICRLDKLSRDLDLQAKLAHTEWDLVIADEAHKMSASRFGDEVKETLRYKLGKLVSSLTRHLLLMTATPHNGKDEDFQLFLALLDPDRFEGKMRDGRRPDFSDLMRRLVKEQLLKFDGKPLFPERRAYSPTYELSGAEAQLYADVTRYVRDEFNRADKLDEKRRGTVGFALTILQRRLASSSEAIYQSLRRRRERLERRLEAERGERSPEPGAALRLGAAIELSPDELDELDDAPETEAEAVEEQILDQATAARTLAELAAEIATLQGLEGQALKVRHGGTDRKWDELRSLLDQGEMFWQDGRRRRPAGPPRCSTATSGSPSRRSGSTFRGCPWPPSSARGTRSSTPPST